ncbi:MAG: 6-phosphogluconolactonase [Bacteroidales bacterium]
MFSNYVATHPALVVERLISDWIETVNNLLAEQQEVTIALSGGHTPQLMFQMIAEYFPGSFPWNRMHFFWVDERWVPHESSESNFGNAKRLLFDNVVIDGSRLHSVRTQNISPQDEALRYAQEIQQYVSQANNIPVFDIIFLGMGDDGHVASIFPGQELLFDADALCAISQHPQSQQQRITLTGRVINHARHIVFLVTGKQKSSILQMVFEGKEVKYPVQRVNPLSGEVFWYLDADAASLIPREKL